MQQRGRVRGRLNNARVRGGKLGISDLFRNENQDGFVLIPVVVFIPPNYNTATQWHSKTVIDNHLIMCVVKNNFHCFNYKNVTASYSKTIWFSLSCNKGLIGSLGISLWETKWWLAWWLLEWLLVATISVTLSH